MTLLIKEMKLTRIWTIYDNHLKNKKKFWKKFRIFETQRKIKDLIYYFK